MFQRPKLLRSCAQSQIRRRNSFRPTLEALEDRSTPAETSWALLADPEGYVFHDTNGNSTFDGGESAVGAGWTVYADANENSALDTGETNELTDAAGHYNLLLPDGTYSIRVVPQAGFQDDRRPLGTLVRDFAAIESGTPDAYSNRYSGLAWVNDSLYVTFSGESGAANVMYRADPLTGAALGPAVPLPGMGSVGEITFDGTDFWGADWRNNYLSRFNFAGEELQRLSFPGMNTNSVEWDGAYLRVLDLTARRIYQIDPSGTGTIVGSPINTPPENCGGLAFDGSHLWVNGRDTDTVYALNPATGAVERSFGHDGDFGYGLAIRGTNLWLSDNSASRVFQYDLGYGGGRIVTVAGADVTGVHLPVFQLGSIAGRVFNDNNANSAQDANDGGLAGWRVYVDSNTNGRYDPWETSAVTDALGNYTLSGLRPGTYKVALDVAGQRQSRWSQVTPDGDGTYSVALSSGEAVMGKNFGNFLDRTSPISAYEWGTFQGGQMSLYTGLAWVDFSTQQGPWSSGTTLNTATTYVSNSTHAGYNDWRLPNLTEGRDAGIHGAIASTPYMSDGLWWTSTPINGQKNYVVSLISGGSYYQYKTANALVAGVRDSGMTIDDGAAGYSATGFSAKSTSGAYQGDQSTAAKGDGSKTATWTFTGLEPGATYKIDVTWKVVNGTATNAPFTVRDGATVVGTRLLNQAVAPNDFTIGETAAWEGLGSYTLTGSTLSVKLTNAANGTVAADAMRIFKVLPSYAPPAPLMAAGGEAATPVNRSVPTTRMVQRLLNEALRQWRIAGADVRGLAGLQIQFANLPGATLATAQGRTITLDVNAAGYDWFVDRTPRSNSEFHRKGDQGEQNRMDLLSVLMHEVGHILGHDHDEGGVMAETLETGVRFTPVVER